MDAPTRRPGDDPWRNLLLSPMSPGDGGVSLSLLVPLMGKSSRQSSITGIGHSLAMCLPRRDATLGEISVVEVGRRTVWGFSNIDFATGEYGAVEPDFREISAGREWRGRLYKAGDYISVRSNGDWVTPPRISPQTCTELSLLSGSLSLVD